MVKGFVRTSVVLLAGLAFGACTVHQSETPSLTGPSQLALSLSVAATPDSISQDGASQSSIKVTAVDGTGSPVQSLPIRLDMVVTGANGTPVVQDFGTLSARNIVTGKDGTASAIFTAPPAPPPLSSPPASGANIVGIRATPSGSNALVTTNSQQGALIRLVPPGVILPPANTPIAQFIISPSPVNLNVPSLFDASSSCPEGVNNACPSTPIGTIASYAWTFSDGATANTQTVNHSFTSTGTFNVTLTVTNDRGLSASSTQQVVVTASAAPTAAFVASQTLPVIGQTVFFNGVASRAAPGHSIVQWSWDFGDGTGPSGPALFSTSHTYTVSGTYSVVLNVRDDTGQLGTATLVLIVGTGNPIPSFTVSPGSPAVGATVLFDASGTQVFGNATIQSYQWTFPTGVPASSVNGPQATTQFTAAGTITVTLTVVDSLGRRGSTSLPVTVTP